jgi:hypothetical protein
MRWVVEIAAEFDSEFDALHEDVRAEILALSLALEQFGPQMSRPRVDALKGSHHANMKELRFSAADGALPSPSIRSARRSFLWQAISPAAANSVSIVN